MSVSISILEAELKLLSIARHALSAHMYEVIRCLAFKNQLASQGASDPFFNLTLNAVELSIFADRALIDTVFAKEEETSAAPESSTSQMIGINSAIEISEDIWIALQVEGHDDEGGETSGIRLRDISAPLAAAGISILFLSTYISDFILIKKHRLELVISILEREHFMSSDAEEAASSSQVARSQSPYFAPLEETSSSSGVTPGSSRDSSSLPPQFPRSLTRNASSFSGGSQDRQRADSTAAPFSPTRLRSGSQHADSRESSLSRSRPGLPQLSSSLLPEIQSPTSLSPTDVPEHASLGDLDDSSAGHTPEQPRSFEKMQESMLSDTSTASGIVDKISLLPDETVCVGLSMQQETIWRSKIIHALFYPEDVLPRRKHQHPHSSSSTSRLARHAASGAGESSLLSSRSSSNHSQLNLFSTTPTPQRPSIAMESRDTPSRSFSSSTQESRSQSLLNTTEEADYPTPFLSLTLTSEGGSLITDIRLLRALFHDQDESVVYAPGGGLLETWSGELAEDEDYSDSDVGGVSELPQLDGLSLGRGRLPQRTNSGRSMYDDSNEWEQVAERQDNLSVNEEEEDEDEKQLFASGRRLFKCLQLDLSSFGLEKAGLAHQFATLITKEKINLLYSATFRTANILVAKRHIRKARNALESASR